jgi:hypothetical protein
LDGDCGHGWHCDKDPISALKQEKPDVRLANDGISAGVALLFVNCIEIVRHDEVGVRPNVASRKVTVILSPDRVLESCVAVFVDLQRCGLECIRAFVKAHEWAHREPRLDFHRLYRILHRQQLEKVNCGYDDRYKQSSCGYFIRLQTANPLAERWHVDLF